MEAKVTLLHETLPAAELAANAIAAVKGGEIDPIAAHISVSRMEKAIALYKENRDVRDITLRELAKYGKSHAFGDCTLEEAEAGVKYDFTQCGDAKLAELYAMRRALDADIKEREAMLKTLPASGMADPETGEVIYPPARSSKTIVKTTFKNR